MNPDFQFESFVVGPSNEAAYAAALKTALEPGKEANPLVLISPVGAGKTHLLQAIGNRIRQRNPGFKVTAMDWYDFMKDIIQAVSRDASQAFCRSFLDADAFLLDGLSFISGKSLTQQVFLNIIREAVRDRRQVVIAGDTLPDELPQISEELRETLATGRIIRMGLPTLEMRKEILLRAASREGLEISDDAAERLAVRDDNPRIILHELHELIQEIPSRLPSS